uniref:Uncharacterized protein n=1 Tax=Ixodes ricinus TaxID=34613 RepID=A0A6B0UZ67_IXORI
MTFLLLPDNFYIKLSTFTECRTGIRFCLGSLTSTQKNNEISTFSFSPTDRKTSCGVILTVVTYAGTGTGSSLGCRRVGALAAASWGCAGRFYCADGADVTDVFSELAPLIAAIAMDTSQLCEIQLDIFRYSDSMGLVSYAGIPVGKCGESSVEDSRSQPNCHCW